MNMAAATLAAWQQQQGGQQQKQHQLTGCLACVPWGMWVSMQSMVSILTADPDKLTKPLGRVQNASWLCVNAC